MERPFDYYDEEEDNLYTSCPNCGKEYDEIDYEYQRCSHCKYDAEKN